VKLARVNSVLLIAIIVVNGYTVVAPLLPAVDYWWQHKNGAKQQAL
jgi:hypothetical protein